MFSIILISTSRKAGGSRGYPLDYGFTAYFLCNTERIKESKRVSMSLDGKRGSKIFSKSEQCHSMYIRNCLDFLQRDTF